MAIQGFEEKFAIDAVEEGGSGSFVFKSDNMGKRYEPEMIFKDGRWVNANSPQRTYEEDKYSMPEVRQRYMTMRDLHDGDALEEALASEHFKEAGEMIDSIRIIKHEEGNPNCEHCRS